MNPPWFCGFFDQSGTRREGAAYVRNSRISVTRRDDQVCVYNHSFDFNFLAMFAWSAYSRLGNRKRKQSESRLRQNGNYDGPDEAHGKAPHREGRRDSRGGVQARVLHVQVPSSTRRFKSDQAVVRKSWINQVRPAIGMGAVPRKMRRKIHRPRSGAAFRADRAEFHSQLRRNRAMAAKCHPPTKASAFIALAGEGRILKGDQRTVTQEDRKRHLPCLLTKEDLSAC